MAKDDIVPVIDLRGIKHIHVVPFVIGGGKKGENEDDATIHAHIYEVGDNQHRTRKGVIRITKPALEELVFTLIRLMGTHVSFLQEERGKPSL